GLWRCGGSWVRGVGSHVPAGFLAVEGCLLRGREDVGAVGRLLLRGARATVELARARQLRDRRAAIDRAGERDDSAERDARNGPRDVEGVEVDLRAADAAAGVGRAGRGEVV